MKMCHHHREAHGCPDCRYEEATGSRIGTLEDLMASPPPPTKYEAILCVRWIGEKGDTITVTSPNHPGLHVGGPADQEAKYLGMALPALRTLLEMSGVSLAQGLAPGPKDPSERLVAALMAMTDEERMSIFHHFCVHCGNASDVTCHCTSDD